MSKRSTPPRVRPEDRWISLGEALAPLPERLLLAHARGQMLFITGAGTSRASLLPDFRGLTLATFEALDARLHSFLISILGLTEFPGISGTDLSAQQGAEARRFFNGDYDIALGMLERRMDKPTSAMRSVRAKVANLLRNVTDEVGKKSVPRAAAIHKALMRLANRGTATTIITTNFDRLLEKAAGRRLRSFQSHALGSIPRPATGAEFSGVLHIHGTLHEDSEAESSFVISDEDFGEYYLRRRVVPDIIYDAARLFHLVLVGYSAKDAPMRYLLNSVAADGTRFGDLKERFAFVGLGFPFDNIELQDWTARGITPIPYDHHGAHITLTNTLMAWASLSPFSSHTRAVDALIKRLVKTKYASANQGERDLFEHLFRRSPAHERLRLTRLVSTAHADFGWFGSIATVEAEIRKETN